MSPTSKPIEYLAKNFEAHIDDLKTLVKIPSVSFKGFPEKEMIHGAEAVAAILKKRGLQNIQLLKIEGAPPYVYGEWLKAPGKPTVLLYAHYDVQPPGRENLWQSPSFEPTRRNSPQGERLFGRGTADDKGGIIMHTAAISAYLDTEGALPVNVKILIEGEEEVGSDHLEELLSKHQKLLQADVMVLTDTGNFDCGVPALTVGLRGLIGMDIEVRSLTKTVHSGMWGGPIPDPVMALSKMLASLVDSNGHILIPGVMEQVRPFSQDELDEFKRIPFTDDELRNQSGLIPNAKILKEGPSALAQIWRLPSLTINAIQASSRAQPSNIICDTAWAKVTIRLVPDMDPDKVIQQLETHLKKNTPWGLELTCKKIAAGGAWAADAKGPAFEAAIAALKQGYGVAPYKIGCGGSIGFVKPFVEALGGAPAILIGVEDPYTNAHGENESILLSDFKKACISETLFFSELSSRWITRWIK